MAEIKDLRRRVNKLRSARLKFVRPDHDPGKQRLDEWAAEATACRARLDYWDNVLVIDGRKIRSPVRLWDSLRRGLITRESASAASASRFLLPSPFG
jgi:hypothetical protein